VGVTMSTSIAFRQASMVAHSRLLSGMSAASDLDSGTLTVLDLTG
jgi:hypothetical protein